MYSDSELAGLNEGGKTPNTRVTSASHARSICAMMVTADQSRAALRTSVKGLVDGNPPYKASDLKKMGQSWRSNANFRESESFLNNALSAYYDIFSEAPTFAEVSFDTGNPENDARWHREATKCFQWLNEQDDELDVNIQLSQYDLVLYGCGPHINENEWDYRSTPIRASQLKLPQRASSNIVKWEQFAVTMDYSPAELYRFIVNSKAAKDRGWNVEETRKAIKNAAPKSFQEKKAGDSWEEAQQHIRNNDLYWHNHGSVISVFHLYWREFPKSGERQGMISHAIVLKDGETDFLFHRVGQYEHWKQVVNPFYYDKGDGTHHSVKGIGVKMYGALELLNRYSNAIYDAGFGVMTTMLKATTPEAVQKAAVVNVGPWSVVQPDFEYVERNVNSILDAPLAIKRELLSTVSSNLSMYRQGLDTKQGNPITAREAMIRYEQGNSLNKTQITRYYEQLDDFWAERWRRAIGKNCDRPEAKKFRAKLKEYGMPEKILAEARVKSVRVIGQGSALQRRATLTEMLGYSGMLPESGRQNLIDAWLASNTGQQFVELFNPKADSQITRDHWDANEENVTMRVGSQPQWTPVQNNVIHAQSHLAAASGALQTVQQGANPMEVLSFLDIAGPHIAVHLQQIGKDTTRKDVFKVLEEQWKAMAAAADKLRALVQKAQQTRNKEAQRRGQAMQEMTSDENLEMMRAMREERRRDMLTQSEIERKTAKARTDIQAKLAKTASGIQTDRMKALASANGSESEE